MALVDDDEIKEVRGILAEVGRRLAILGRATHKGLEDGEKKIAIFWHFAFLADVLRRNPDELVFRKGGEGIEGLVGKNVSVGQEEDARAARGFTAQVPARVKELPCNLEGVKLYT